MSQKLDKLSLYNGFLYRTFEKEKNIFPYHKRKKLCEPWFIILPRRGPVLYPQILTLTAAQDKISVDTMLCPW
jgi:hypothetical protein